MLNFYSRFIFLPNLRQRCVILHWPTKSCQNRTTLSGVMTSYRFFFKMAACSHIGFDLDNIRPPMKCNCWCVVGPQMWSSSDLFFRRFSNFYILPFWLEIAYSRSLFIYYATKAAHDNIAYKTRKIIYDKTTIKLPNMPQTRVSLHLLCCL